MPSRQYTNKYDMWGDTVKQGINFRAVANEQDKDRTESTRRYDETREDRNKQWNLENERADQRMEISQENLRMLKEKHGLDQDLRQLTTDLYKGKNDFLRSGGDPSMASKLLSAPLDAPVEIIEQGGAYQIKFADGTTKPYAKNHDEYMANVMASFGDEGYMKALFTKRINQKMQAVDPSKVVSQDGKVGVLEQSSEGGAINFNEIKGGLDAPAPKPGDAKKNADAAKAMTTAQMKDLKAVLSPFAKPGKQLIDFETGEINSDGMSALDAALKLINKQKDGKPLTASEQKKVRHAYRAWEMYGQISDRVSAPYYGGGDNNAGSWKQWQ